MNTPEFSPLASFPPEHLEVMLSDGGRYYRTLLLPALLEGFEAVPAEHALILFQLYFCEDTPVSDEFYWSMQLDCSVPAFRDYKQQALTALQKSIVLHTGLSISNPIIEELLGIAGERERMMRDLDIEPETENFGGKTVRPSDTLFQFVVTTDFLSQNASSLFGKHVYSVHWIRAAENAGVRTADTQHTGKSHNRTAQVIDFKSIRTEYGVVKLIVSANRQFYFVFTSQPDTAADELCLVWPDALEGVCVPLNKRQHPSGNLDCWIRFGFLDDSDRFVLSLEGQNIHLEDPCTPISFLGF